MTSIPDKISAQVIDTFEKVASPASRAGVTVERVGKLIEGDISSPSIIAQIISERSSNGFTYDESDVETMHKLHLDSKTTVGITVKQVNALTKDYEDYVIGDNCVLSH